LPLLLCVAGQAVGQRCPALSSALGQGWAGSANSLFTCVSVNPTQGGVSATFATGDYAILVSSTALPLALSGSLVTHYLGSRGSWSLPRSALWGFAFSNGGVGTIGN
jgi:hypothetical protein